MITFTLNTPATVGSLADPQTITSLQITGIVYSSTPSLAPIGTGVLAVTMTDPKSGVQQTVNYADATVPTLWAAAQSPVAGTAFGDIVSTVIFAKLVADGKLPLVA